MFTRSQCPGYNLHGIFLDCFALYFSKQTCNTARRIHQADLQLISNTFRLIGKDKVLFQWGSKDWSWEPHGCARNSESICNKNFSDSYMLFYILFYFPQSQHYEGKKEFRNGHGTFLSLKFPLKLDFIFCHKTSWHQAAAFYFKYIFIISVQFFF